MSTGKYLSLEEARKKDQLKRFCKEHPSEGDEKDFDDLLGRMAKNKPTKKPKESLNKYPCRHAVEKRHPVNNCFYWIPAFAGTTI